MVQGTFSGYFKNNQPHCYGTFKYLDPMFSEDNFTYLGEIQGGLAHGQGVLTNGAKDRYVGQFKDDKRNGQGVLTNGTKDRYVGQFENGKLNGSVQVFSSAGKLLLEGDFKAGK